MNAGDDIAIRRAEPADGAAILALLHATRDSAPSSHDEAFFTWKHLQSPFGASPSWVAEADGLVVGFRTFMRWDFECNGELIHAVRAVDLLIARRSSIPTPS